MYWASSINYVEHHPLTTLRSEGAGVVRAQRNHNKVCITKQRNMGMWWWSRKLDLSLT
jgi:hypothetical protein